MKLQIIGFWPDYDDEDAYAVVQVQKTEKILSRLKRADLRFAVDDDIIEIWIPITQDGKYISNDEHRNYIEL